MRNAALWGSTLAVGFIGGLAFALLGLPLPWILGAAFSVMLVNTLRPGRAAWPRWLSDAGVVVIGLMLGQRITLDTLLAMARDLPGMIAAGVLWIAVCYMIGIGFAKLARLSEMNAVLGCVPGGLPQMVLLAEEMKGADPGTVALMQTSRLVVVLYTVPFLAAFFTNASAVPAAEAARAAAAGAVAAWPPLYGYLMLPLVPLSAWLARRLGLPAGEFLGPIAFVGALSAAGAVFPVVPDPLMAAAQLSMGIYIGLRIQPRVVFANRRFGPLAFAVAALLVAISIAAAWVLSLVTGDSVVTWFLSLAPGGLGEVAVTALLLHADVAQVTAYQLFRLLFVLLAAPPLLRFALAKRIAAKG